MLHSSKIVFNGEVAYHITDEWLSLHGSDLAAGSNKRSRYESHPYGMDFMT
jgi:hypothetical protein